jgi:hypothetical protein
MPTGEIDLELEMLNDRYAVLNLNGKTVVMRTDRTRLEFTSIYDFRNFHMHKKRRNAKGDLISIGTAWLNYPNHREYHGIEFAPGKPQELPDRTFNSWAGWAVQRAPGDCSLYLQHIRDIICSGNEEHATYVLNWMADMVQSPLVLPGVAIALRGGQGTGKGVFVQELGALCGRHFTHLVHNDLLTNTFNAHLVEAQLVYADEAFFAGDRRHESVLKGLITEATTTLTRKGIDSIPGVRNCARLILASNSDWVIPAGPDERRFFVLEVSDARKQDHKYFSDIKHQMENGGRAALLHFLMERDISKVNIRKVPLTEALAVQKLMTRGGIDSFIEMACEEGCLPVSGPEPNVAFTGDRTVDAQEDSDGTTLHRTERREGLWTYLKKNYHDLGYRNSSQMKALLREYGCAAWRSNANRGLRFPPLLELRKRYEAKHGPREWPKDVVEWGRLKNPALERAETKARAERWKTMSAMNSDDEASVSFCDGPPIASDAERPQAPAASVQPATANADDLFQKLADEVSPDDGE